VGGAEARVIAFVIGVLAIAAGVVFVVRRLAARRRRAALDDEAIREIERTGTFEGRDPADDEPLDLDEIAAAEEEFWKEGWDEPEEYER
jgi:hypothetical protein